MDCFLLPYEVDAFTKNNSLEVLDQSIQFIDYDCHSTECRPLLRPILVFCGPRPSSWTQTLKVALFAVSAALTLEISRVTVLQNP